MEIALATVPSRRYRSIAGYGTVKYRSLPATVPSRLDGTIAGVATVVNTISFSLSVTRLVLTPALTLNDPLHP